MKQTDVSEGMSAIPARAGGLESCRMPSARDHQLITVLVVEDEFLIRVDIADRLKEAGFSVFEAESADAAIRILEREATFTSSSPISICRARWTALSSPPMCEIAGRRSSSL